MKAFAGFHPRPRFENGTQIFVGSSRVGGRFEYDQSALPQMRSNGPSRLQDERNIGLAVLVERRWDADDHRIDILHPAKIGCGGETAGFNLLRYDFGGDMVDVTPPLVEGVDLV